MTAASTSTDWPGAIAKLPPEEQHNFLVRLSAGETNLTAKLQKALRPFLATQSTATKQQRRSVKTLLEIAEIEQEKAESLAKEKAKAERIKALKKLAPRESELWEEVEMVMREKKGYAYDKATKLLQDLRDLAVYQQQEIMFEARLYKLCENYPPTKALRDRFKKAKLL